MDPTASLPTRSDDVTFTAGGRAVPGTVLAPAGGGPWPAVLLLAGSGPTDRDWNSRLIPTHNGSGKLLAEHLAAHGAVVLRFDKAGSGANPGPPPEAWTLDTYRDETLAALAALRARADVRGDRIFVAGHSEGGIHATRLALAAPESIAGVLYLSSAARSLADTMLTQLEAQMRNPLAGLSDEVVDGELESLRAAFADFLAGKPVDPSKASRLPPVQKLVAGLVAPLHAPLMRGLLGYDNAAEAPKVAAPALLVNGGKDLQISLLFDTKPLHDALLAAGREATLAIAPDADHVLKHQPLTIAELRANLQAVQDAYNADGRVLDPGAAGAIVRWLAAHAG